MNERLPSVNFIIKELKNMAEQWITWKEMSPYTDLLLLELISPDFGGLCAVCQISFVSIHFDCLLQRNVSSLISQEQTKND